MKKLSRPYCLLLLISVVFMASIPFAEAKDDSVEIRFEKGRADLSEESRGLLKKFIEDNKLLATHAALFVEGYDDVLTRTRPGSPLALKRAMALTHFLCGQGIAAARLTIKWNFSGGGKEQTATASLLYHQRMF
jgi:outer membrane protein OmpA-like peptidoglycan-associated protein